ncbi:MAG TPA: 4-hydroxy-tetrahydrodipicolinate reductase [Chthoniobacterales bacterium]|nr:4-hydroxy-tetrahydrodipicolinate reductase [Chthoniobacterales bacterium]
MRRLLVQGASGRLGQTISRLAQQSDAWQVTASEKDAPLEPLVATTEVSIDVSVPEASVQIASLCARYRKPLVIGTTGHSDAQMKAIESAAVSCPILVAPNFSVGVNLLFWLTRETAKVLGEAFDAEVIEMHHKLKKDAPSGTAKRIAEILAGARSTMYEKAVRHGRQGMVGQRTPQEIGVHAVRGGSVVGEHTVVFAGEGERIELIHRAASRDTFARGALQAAGWLLGQAPGRYDMQDVLGLR